MSATQTIEQILALANMAAETADDMNIAEAGGGSKLFPEGYAMARLVEYIEFGQQPQTFNGVSKGNALEFQLAFALYGEGYQNDDGTPYIFRPYRMSLSRNDKAGAFLGFKAMNWKGIHKHFGQMIGEAFLVRFVTKPPKDPTKKPRSVIDLKATLPPLDAISKQPYPVPAPRAEDLKFFSWTFPDLTTWHSFFQEGKYDDGHSKNVVQETMLSATDFHGSALQMLLATHGVAYTIPAPKAKPAQPAGAAVAQPLVQPMAMPAAQPVAAVVQPQVALPNVSQPAVAPASSVAVSAAPAPSGPAFDPTPPGQPQQVVAQIAQPTVAPVAAVAMPALPNVAMPALPQLPVAA